MNRISKYLLMHGILYFAAIPMLYSQVQVSNYSEKNDVYAIHIKNDTVWIGSSGGVVVRNVNFGDTIATYTVDKGLCSNFITSITVDKNGTKWFGSIDNGASSLKGNQWKTYNIKTGDLDNHVYCLEADLNGGVWAGTPSGAFYYNGSVWTHYNTAVTVSGQVRSISSTGSITWFGTDKGLVRFDGTNWVNYTVISTSGGLISNDISCIEAKADSVFIGTKIGISYYNQSTTIWNQYPNVGNTEILDIEINSFGQVYAGTPNGLYFFAEPSWITAAFFFTRNKIAELEFDNQNRIWAGFNDLGGGVNRSNGSTPDSYIYSENTVCGNNVSGFASGNNRIYLSTRGRGLSVLNNNVWTTYNLNNELPNDTINDLTIDRNGLVWLATNNYACTFNGSFFSAINASSNLINPKVNAVAIDSTNITWFGTKNGVSAYNGSICTNYTTSNGLLNNEVIAITIDKLKQIWFLHPDGISMYNGTSFTTYSKTFLTISAVARLFDIEADKVSGVWIGSSEGVIHLDASVPKVYKVADGLANDNVFSLHVDKNNLKYFGTGFNGISIFNGTNWQRINYKDTIASNRINAVYVDSVSNNIWSGGEWGGVSKLIVPPLQLTAAANPPEVCAGAMVNLLANVKGGFGFPYNYQWSSSAGNLANTQSVQVMPATNTTYYITAGDGIGKANSFVAVSAIQTNASPITGLNQVCSNLGQTSYSVPTTSNRAYNWTIQGGTILSGQNTTNVNVIWNNALDSGRLQLKETNILKNCSVDQSYKVIINKIDTSKITGPSQLCEPYSQTTYSVPLTANRNYNWTITGGNIVSGSNTASVDVNWTDTFSAASLFLKETDSKNNCSINQEYKVALNKIDPSQIIGPDKICGSINNSANYSVASDINRTYAWTIQGGSIISGQNTSAINVSWNNDTRSGNISLTETGIQNKCSILQNRKISIDPISGLIRRKGQNLIISNDSGMQYQWYLNQVPIANSNKQFYYIERNGGAINGNYQVEVITPNNCHAFSNPVAIALVKVKAYPIPTKDYLNIEFYNDKLAEGKLEIKNLKGVVVQVLEFNQSIDFYTIKLDVTKYKTGIYNYSIYLDKELFVTEKFIVE